MKLVVQPVGSQGPCTLLNINTKLTGNSKDTVNGEERVRIATSLQIDVRGLKEDFHMKLPFLF